MRETNISGNLNCVYATMLAWVCNENKKELELEKNKILLKYFVVKGSILKGCRRTVTLWIYLIFVTRILHNIKVLVVQ